MQENEQQPRLLQTLGMKALQLARYAAARAIQLPNPLGPSIAAAEEFLEPIVHAAEDQGLNLLKVLDDKILVVGEAIERCVHGAMNVISYPRKVVTEFHKRGIVGSAADAWAEYKDPVTDILHKLPGSSLASPLLNAVADLLPLRNVSDWLVKHSNKSSLPDTKTIDDGEEQENHPFVEAKLADDHDQHDQQQQQQGKDQVEVGGGGGKKDDEELDELTKLLDAGWGL